MLHAARDRNKDQSYFLWTLTQKQLAHCLFPIGEYVKPKVRAIARKAGLPTAEKKDSQGICFLGKVSVSDFLKSYIPSRRGAIITTEGIEVGRHDGAQFYTIGQRHGLNLGDKQQVTRDKGNVRAHYVSSKDAKRNLLVVAEGESNPALYRKEITLRNVNFITPQHSNILKNVGMSGVRVFARVRYRQPLSAAKLLFSNSRELENKKRTKSKSVKLVFEKPQKFVAPGQSAVFYTKTGEMLGGGVIA
jgi:tRNA-specific 2-thiouridylase